jgi:hypothetical protein
MTQFPFTGSQASTDFTQGLGVSQLAKKHGDELAPTAETTSMTFRVVLEKILQTQVKAEPP